MGPESDRNLGLQEAQTAPERALQCECCHVPCPTRRGSTDNTHSTCKFTSGVYQQPAARSGGFGPYFPTKGSIWIKQPKFVRLHVSVKRKGGFGDSRSQSHVQEIPHLATHQSQAVGHLQSIPALCVSSQDCRVPAKLSPSPAG